MSRRGPDALGFEAIRIEGGLLNAEYLSKIARLEAEAQAESDYHVPKGLKLRDELGRYWRIGQALWQAFENGLERTDRDPAAHTRDTLLVPLLRDVLGFTDVAPCGAVELGDG